MTAWSCVARQYYSMNHQVLFYRAEIYGTYMLILSAGYAIWIQPNLRCEMDPNLMEVCQQLKEVVQIQVSRSLILVLGFGQYFLQ